MRSENGLFDYPLVGGLMDRGGGIHELMTYRSRDVDGTSWEKADSFGSDQLYLVRGTDAAGSGWSEPYPVHRTSWVERPSITIVNNTPVICYAPVFGDGLFCASWKNF